MANTAEADHRVAGVGDRLTELVNSRLLGRRIEIAAVADDLLALAHDVTWLRVRPDSNDSLTFTFRGAPAVVLPVDSAMGKLRSLCARIAKLCQETTNSEFHPYGGEGGIVRTDGADRRHWHASWANTAYLQELFLIRWEMTPWGKT